IGGVEKLAAEAGLPFIVSGGVSDLRDIEGLAGLGSAGVEGVIVGTALYEEKFSLEEAIAAGRG
ncbi:MAG: HisA/HisF-related TIM barrel protein, partial [Terriglobia bacterium]